MLYLTACLDVRLETLPSAFVHKVKISISRLASHSATAAFAFMLTYRSISAENRPGAVWYR